MNRQKEKKEQEKVYYQELGNIGMRGNKNIFFSFLVFVIQLVLKSDPRLYSNHLKATTKYFVIRK